MPPKTAGTCGQSSLSFGIRLLGGTQGDGTEMARILWAWRRGSHHEEGSARGRGRVLITAAGAIFTLQGLGAIGGSAMSGVTFWAVAGPVIALAGLAMAAIGLRRRLAS
jgi:hypothetical protein